VTPERVSPGAEEQPKKIAILGSTGSIGTQAVDVAARLGGRISVEALTAHGNGGLLLEQATGLGARVVCMTHPDAAAEYSADFRDRGIEFHEGTEGLRELLGARKYDLVLNALVGVAGLPATLQVLDAGIALALANKESLVAGGPLVMQAARESGALLIPVDSEHSAIFQCLRGERRQDLKRIILTASGGPFVDLTAAELAGVSVDRALAHPTWKMGRKVTIDSSTLMNKGLEVLEARYLFDVELDMIEVLLHRESVIHSMTEMVDGSVLAQLGVPDMRTPIQYAMTFPERAAGQAQSLSLAGYGSLTFGGVDTGRFPCLELAYSAGREGATFPAAMNAADEEAVAAFLEGRISFTGIPEVIERVLDGHSPLPGETLEEVIEADARARELARLIIDRPGVEA
jgi:1-deoxy-D-xylulose-5-phosphate reductoisomerase